MKNILICAVAVLALAACQEEDDDTSATEETETPQVSAQDTEDTATADDGGGAMDGATEQNSPAAVAEVTQDAIDACIDALRAQAGSAGGTVQSTEFSEANSLVMLQDNDGSNWRCIVSNDGSSATVEAEQAAAGADNITSEDTATADDGAGAMDGPASDIMGFVGARAGQAEGGLNALGFESIRSEGLTTYWFNRDTGICAAITTSDGVFSNVAIVPAEDC